MPRNQGLIRLSKGITRELQTSEKLRKYLFVSKDTSFKKDCSGKLTVYLNDMKIGTRYLDEQGRIFPKLNYPELITNADEVTLTYNPKDKSLKVQIN